MRATGMISEIAGAEVWLGQLLVCHLPAKAHRLDATALAL